MKPAAQKPSWLNKDTAEHTETADFLCLQQQLWDVFSGELNTAILDIYLSEKVKIIKEFLKVLDTVTVPVIVS